MRLLQTMILERRRSDDPLPPRMKTRGKRAFVRWVLMLLGLCAFANDPLAETALPKRPNVVFIAVDDLRPQMGCYGVSWMKTPNLDRLASHGRVFGRHYVQVPTCGASRYSLLTGLRPSGEADYWNEPFTIHQADLARRPTESLVHLFRQNGYHTVAIGKVSHNPDNSRADLPRSWDEVIVLKGPWKLAVRAYVQPVNPETYPPFEAGEANDDAYPDGVLATEAVKTLQRLKERPFFLALGFYKPHLPFNAPKRFWDLYKPQEIPPPPFPELPAGINMNISLHPSFELVEQYRGMPAGSLDSEAYRRQLRQGYSAAVSYVDAQIGKVLDQLDRLGLSSNTVIIVWGDNGWHLGDLGIWGKHTAFEYALRTPLIVRIPAMKSPGVTTDALIEAVDLYPTLVELCGLPKAQGLSGASLVGLLQNPSLPGKAQAFGYHRPWRNPVPPNPWGKTMRTDRYRFTVWTKEREGGEVLQAELYDHATDPEESNNLVARYPDVVARLLPRMNADGLSWSTAWAGQTVRETSPTAPKQP
jgi:iduronate 2-sulfatase